MGFPWWGNPILVTPSSKYVGDQAATCVEKLIADHGEEGFKTLMSRGMENIDINEFFGNGDYIIDSTRSFFAGQEGGNLGKHPNYDGINPQWLGLINQSIQEKQTPKLEKNVAYNQSVTTGNIFADSLKKISEYQEEEKPAVDLFLCYLNQQFGLDIQNIDDITARINRVSEKHDNESRVKEKDIADYQKTQQQKVSAEQIREAINFVQELKDLKSPICAQLIEENRFAINQILEKNGVMNTAGLESALRHFVFSSALGAGYNAYQAGRQQYSCLVEQLPTDIFAQGLKIGETFITQEKDEEHKIKLIEISEPYDLSKRKICVEIDDKKMYFEIIDHKLEQIYSKKFRLAQKEAYGRPKKNQIDIPCPIGGDVMMAVNNKDGSPMNVGSIVKGGQVIKNINAMKLTTPICVPENITTAKVVAIEGDNMDKMGAGQCIMVIRIETENEINPNFPYAVPEEKDIITPPNDQIIAVELNNIERLKPEEGFRKNDEMGKWIFKDSQTKPILAPHDCLVDMVYGNKTTEQQPIETGMVALKIKNMVD